MIGAAPIASSPIASLDQSSTAPPPPGSGSATLEPTITTPFWNGFALAQRRRDRERERVEAEELAQRVATMAIQEARAASARVSTQAAIDRARREAKEASARMTAALERMILAALAVEANNRLAEMEEELAALMLLQVAVSD